LANILDRQITFLVLGLVLSLGLVLVRIDEVIAVFAPSEVLYSTLMALLLHGPCGDVVDSSSGN
jgi:hypothetical protein